jgi:site-specific DNA-methyltransferase (adenine-specific)
VTLYHGDCREILPTIADASIDCIFTDPPYGHNNNNGDLIHHWEAALGRGPAGESRPIANDGGIDTNSLIRWSFTEWRRLLKPGGCCCCCGGGGGPDPQFARWSLWLDEVLDFKQMVIWDKGPIGMGWHYRRSYETVLVAQKAGAACKWYDDSQTIENIIRPGDYGIRKIIPSAAHHPTPKPEALVRHFVRLHTKPGDLVLDPFLGAGPTARACKDIGRRCVGIELDEQWIEIAARRMAQEPLPLGA